MKMISRILDWVNPDRVLARAKNERQELFRQRIEAVCNLANSNKTIARVFFTLVERQAWSMKECWNPNSSAARVSEVFPHLLTVKRGSPSNGGGSWIHPKLAVHLDCFLGNVGSLAYVAIATLVIGQAMGVPTLSNLTTAARHHIEAPR